MVKAPTIHKEWANNHVLEGTLCNFWFCQRSLSVYFIFFLTPLNNIVLPFASNAWSIQSPPTQSNYLVFMSSSVFCYLSLKPAVSSYNLAASQLSLRLFIVGSIIH